MGLYRAFEDSKKKLRVLVECDTGANRCGVISPSAALKLAKVISSNNNLIFGGLMTYPPISEPEQVNSFLAEAKDLIEKNGIKVETISIGGSPDMWKVKKMQKWLKIKQNPNPIWFSPNMRQWQTIGERAKKV